MPLLLANDTISPSVESIVPSILTVQLVWEFAGAGLGEHETNVAGMTGPPWMLPKPAIVPLFLIVPVLEMLPALSTTPEL